MEQLNRIEIRGVVGSVKLSIVNEKQMVRFSVVTNYAYKDKEGAPVIEETWHNVVAFEGRTLRDLSKIEKGSRIQVIGRLRMGKYTGMDGIDRTTVEILAQRYALMDPKGEFQYEFPD